MRNENIQPRRRLMEIWAAAAAYSMRSGKWTWGDSLGSSSITDADQLLTFLLPATVLPDLRLEDINNVAPDATAALVKFGGNTQTPRVLIGALEEFVAKYTRADGTCDFSGGNSYIAVETGHELTDEQRDVDCVPSFVSSISLCLAALGFLAEYLDFLPQRSALQPRVVKLREALSLRLTSALVGLLRGFTLNPMSQESDEGRELLRLLNQDKKPQRQVLAMFNERMETVRGRLGEARLGVAKASELEDPELLFEIGWTWGIAADAPPIEDVGSVKEVVGEQRTGVAVSLPFLYFTMLATEAIEQLFLERTRVLGLLNEDQERLAAALSIRRDLTQMYWSKLARFGESWPLEDMPWRTVDGEETDYYTLLVCSVLIQDLQRRNANENDLRRLEPLMRDLASRSRITWRPLRADQMTSLHSPGLLIELELDQGLEADQEQPVTAGWPVRDFAPVLFKRSAQLAVLTNDPDTRDRLLALGSQTWTHLQRRQLGPGPGEGLWDAPAGVFSHLDESSAAMSWTMTGRTVDALVTAGGATLGNRAARSQDLVAMAAAMVSETEYLLNQQLMSTPALPNAPYQASLQRIREDLQRASSLIDSLPALAVSLAVNAANQLDGISLGRNDVDRGM
jgi:hypothetical protein